MYPNRVIFADYNFYRVFEKHKVDISPVFGNAPDAVVYGGLGIAGDARLFFTS
jgi:hypothetical protein